MCVCVCFTQLRSERESEALHTQQAQDLRRQTEARELADARAAADRAQRAREEAEGRVVALEAQLRHQERVANAAR